MLPRWSDLFDYCGLFAEEGPSSLPPTFISRPPKFDWHPVYTASGLSGFAPIFPFANLPLDVH